MTASPALLGLDELLAREPARLGQIQIATIAPDTFSLRHRADTGRTDLLEYAGTEAAAELARYDDLGKYRPLKTAPNLRRGWQMQVAGRAALAAVLEEFYPARLPAFSAWQKGEMRTTSLRETLGRQSGMYRIAATMTDVQANALIGRFCRSEDGCLRTILWKRNGAGDPPSTFLPSEKYEPVHDQTGRGEPTVPLLCQEACNLVVAAAREAVKAKSAA